METFRIARGVARQEDLRHIIGEIISQAARHKVKVTVCADRATRSLDQNALLWSLYTDIIRMGGEAMQGWTKEELHTFFLGNHHGWEVTELFGDKRKRPIKRSSKLNKIEFAEFVDSIVRFMAERGVHLTLPGDM